MTPIQFGTDGWRSVMSEEFTFANAARVAQATADFWNAEPVPGTAQRIVIDYDRHAEAGTPANARRLIRLGLRLSRQV